MPHRPHAHFFLTQHTPDVSTTTDVLAVVADTMAAITGATIVKIRRRITKVVFLTRAAKNTAGIKCLMEVSTRASKDAEMALMEERTHLTHLEAGVFQ